MACALSIDDVALLAQAYTHRDSDAVLGLVGRQKAIPLAKGTAVTVLLADSPYGGIDALYVESGSYIGERWYGVAALMAPD
jgi:heptaprenylglyceryl phosphate synthase